MERSVLVYQAHHCFHFSVYGVTHSWIPVQVGGKIEKIFVMDLILGLALRWLALIKHCVI